jgi:hypothetical protein
MPQAVRQVGPAKNVGWWITSVCAAGAIMLVSITLLAGHGLRRRGEGEANPRLRERYGALAVVVAVPAIVVFVAAHYFSAALFRSAVEQRDFAIGVGLVVEMFLAYWPIVLTGLILRSTDAWRLARILPGRTTAEHEAKAEQLVDAVTKSVSSVVPLWLASFALVFGHLFARVAEIDPGMWFFVLAFALFYFLPTHIVPDQPAALNDPW